MPVSPPPLATLPRLCSRPLHWSLLHLQYYRRSPFPRLELQHSDHVIVLPLGQAVPLEARIGRLEFSGSTPAGSLLIAPAGSDRHICWRQAADFALIRIQPADLAFVATQITHFEQTRLQPQTAVADPLLAQIGRLLTTELERQTPGLHYYVQHLIDTFLAHLIYRYSRGSTLGKELVKTRFRRVLIYIDQHLDRPLKLESLAQVAGLSPYHFARQFKQALGLPPRQYIIRQRLEKTKRLLHQSELSILEIALQCGFTNQSHLNLHFGRLLGMTPKAYRDAYQLQRS